MLLNHSKKLLPRRFYSFCAFLEDLDSRSLLRNSFPADLKNYKAELGALLPFAYAGFDPTAESLHIGNFVVLSNLLRCTQHGIRPIVVVGGATALIGDPSGKLAERGAVSAEFVARNADKIISQCQSIFDRISPRCEPIIVNNIDWFGKMGMIDYLRNCKRMQLGEMLRMGAVKSRMDSGISFTEFSYQTMQAYDWLVLSQKYGCRFQLGGSDQLGHLNFGAHYIKKVANVFAAGVCLPLLTDASGNKLGKTEGGNTIWLDATLTSPFHFYQHFAQLHDDVAVNLFLQLSLRPVDQLESVLKSHRENLGKWVAQQFIATELTEIVHGKEGLEMAQRCSNALFNSGKNADFSNLSRDEIVQLFGNSTLASRNKIRTVGQLADLTRDDTISGSSLLRKGAFSVNGKKQLDPEEPVVLADLVLPHTDDLTVVRWGKRKYSLVRWIL